MNDQYLTITTAKTTIMSYVTGTAGVLLGLTFSQWLALGSLAFVALTYLTNRHYHAKDNKRKQEKHVLEMKILEQKARGGYSE